MKAQSENVKVQLTSGFFNATFLHNLSVKIESCFTSALLFTTKHVFNEFLNHRKVDFSVVTHTSRCMRHTISAELSLSASIKLHSC